MSLNIGESGWSDELRAMTASLGNNFWADFTPCNATEITHIEKEIGRKRPDDVVEFYRTIGYEEFSERGGIFAPDEVLASLPAPLYFIMGSLLLSKEWCSEQEHRSLRLSRGNENPAPTRFTEEVLRLDGIPLYDLLQVGTNGGGCYHQLYVGPESKPIGYCLLTDSQTMEDTCESFSLGLEKIITFYLKSS